MPVTGLCASGSIVLMCASAASSSPRPGREAFAAIAAQVKATTPDKMAAIVGDLAAAEEIKALKDLMTALGVTNLDCRQDGAKTRVVGNCRARPICSTPRIAGVEAADAILLVGANPRWEAPVLNARIRKAWLAGGVKIANIGPAVDLTYPVRATGHRYRPCWKRSQAAAMPLRKVLKDAKRPMIILGSGR